VRIAVHDYSGHPFQVQLSRELARRGHQVRHIFSSSFQTPKGNLERTAADPEGFEIVPVALSAPFLKDSLLRRRAQEIETGRLVAALIAEFAPDVVISSNAPLDTQRVILKAARRQGARFVFWLQDIYSEAIARLLPRKLPIAGALVARYYRRLEASMLRASDHVVAITEDFGPTLDRYGVGRAQVSVIENWAPLDEMAPLARENAWAREHMPAVALRVVYSGTLGYKHNPGMLADLARQSQARVLVYAEGRAANQLKAEAAGLGNLSVQGWLPFADLPGMLAGADILVAMIEADAGHYSVPSKVLSYLCAGRPIVAAIPPDNLAGRLLLRESAGIVVAPGDSRGLTEAVRKLAADPQLRELMGRNGRAYAERTFGIGQIGDRFETILRGIAGAEADGVRSIPLARAAAGGGTA
jgi:colanic acid biosynthesis glycosyl transferase WcaI